jgi:hypothetical protein
MGSRWGDGKENNQLIFSNLFKKYPQRKTKRGVTFDGLSTIAPAFSPAQQPLQHHCKTLKKTEKN